MMNKGLLIFFSLFSLIFAANENSFEFKWKNIVHLYNKNLGRYNQYFYFSYPNVTWKNELNATIEAFRKDKKTACIFPYRYKFLKKYYSLPEVDLNKCSELQKFLKTFKDEQKIGLVFSSEYESSPQSSFGHVMLVFLNDKSFIDSDVVHFAAKAKKEGFFKYSYDGLMGNFDAFYIRERLYKKIYIYNIVQQRTMYIYELNLTKSEIENLKLHLFELRRFRAKYYFMNYNCSSATIDLLNAVSQKPVNYQKIFVLPIDSVIYEKKLISSRKVLIPLNKQIILLLHKMTLKQKREFQNALNGNIKDYKSLPNIVKEALNKYIEYSFRTKRYVYGNYDLIKSLKYNPVKLDESELSDPLDSVFPREIRFFITNNYKELYLRPFLIDKYDYQTSLTNEKSYRLFTFDLIYKNKKLKINYFDIFLTESMQKRYGEFLKPISWKVYMGFNRYNKKDKLSFNYELGFGQSWQSFVFFNYFIDFGFYAFNYSRAYIKPEFNLFYYLNRVKFFVTYQKKLFEGYYSKQVGFNYKINKNFGFIGSLEKNSNEFVRKAGIYFNF